MSKGVFFAICISLFLFLVALNMVYFQGAAYKMETVQYYKVSVDFSTIIDVKTHKWTSGDFLGRFSIFNRDDYLYGFDITQKCKALGIPFDNPTAHYVKVVDSDEEYYAVYNVNDLPYSTSALYSWEVFEAQFSFVSDIFGFIRNVYNGIKNTLVTMFGPLVDFIIR